MAEHFHCLFPALTEKEARQILGAYLFPGRKAQEKVDSLSGGEKARLVLAELLNARPNLLLLDEPTNHMDIQAKETLESAFKAYTGTILFVSHDRYFIRQVADAILVFENGRAMYYPFGYEHYLDRVQRSKETGESMTALLRAEDQALLEGMRNVPEKERHRLKEYSTEELTRDWEYRLAAEERDAALREYLDAVEKVENLRVDEYRAWAENSIVSPEERKELPDNTVRVSSAAERLADAEIKMLLLLMD